MIDLALPWVLAALPLPLLVRWLVKPARPSGRGALRVPFFSHASALARAGGHGTGKRRLALALTSLAWVLLVVAAAQPTWVGEPVAIPTQGRDLMLALDVSGSMAQDDFDVGGRPVDRLSIVKAVARQFVEAREGDRLGLVLFGSRAYLQTPLTFDRETVVDMLGEAELGLAGKETALGDALGLSVKHLKDRPADEKVVVLLSDGANNVGALDPLRAAELAAQAGIRVYTIGVGADTMVVPGLFGNQVVANQDLDEQTLADIAERTGGSYFRAKDTAALVDVYERIDQLEPTEGDATWLRPTRSLFHWPAAAAFALGSLLLAGRLLSQTSFRRVLPIPGAR